MLAISFFIVSVTTGGVVSHLVPLLTDRGVSLRNATDMVSIAGLALIGGRLLAGYLLDRIHAPLVAAAFFTAPMIGITALVSTSRPNVAGLGAVLIGIGLGAEVDLIAFLLSRYLGMRSFGEIYGFFFGIFMLGSGLGPLAMGAWFDKAGSYTLMLVGFATALVLSIVVVLRLGAYRYPARHRLEQHKTVAVPV
jgi:cyanate permease